MPTVSNDYIITTRLRNVTCSRMSLPVKGYSGSNSNKLPKYWLVQDSEVIIKNREARSLKPQVHYQISSPNSAKCHDDTIELMKPAQEPDNSFSSEGETLANLNASQVPHDDGAVFPSPSGVPIVHDLGSLLPKTTTHTSVVYTDSIVTSASTPIGLIPTAPPTATTSFSSSDTTNVVTGPTATVLSIFFWYDPY